MAFFSLVNSYTENGLSKMHNLSAASHYEPMGF
jgi:hypothetical protein